MHRSTHTSNQQELMRTDLTDEGQMDVDVDEIRRMKLTRTLTGKKTHLHKQMGTLNAQCP